MRYSIPVFFSAAKVAAPAVSWAYTVKGGRNILSARNSGGSRMRISNLKMKSNSGATQTISPGLAGYVLAGSTKIWKQRGNLKGARRGVKVFAKGNNGKISARTKAY